MKNSALNQFDLFIGVKDTRVGKTVVLGNVEETGIAACVFLEESVAEDTELSVRYGNNSSLTWIVISGSATSCKVPPALKVCLLR